MLHLSAKDKQILLGNSVLYIHERTAYFGLRVQNLSSKNERNACIEASEVRFQLTYLFAFKVYKTVIQRDRL